MPTNLPPDTLLTAIRAIVGDRGLLTDPADTDPYAEDWRRLYRGHAAAVVRPGSTQEVAAVIRLCAEAGVATSRSSLPSLNGTQDAPPSRLRRRYCPPSR